MLRTITHAFLSEHIAMIRARLSMLVAFLAVVLAALGIGAPAPSPRVIVMTLNLYAGGDFGENGFDLGATFESVRETNFHSRANVIARIIAQQRPQVIALQEVARWRTETFFGNERDDIDFLAILQQKLLARGLHYTLAGALTTIDFEAPGEVDGDFLNIRWTERLVTLVRQHPHLRIDHVRARRYDDTHTLSLPVAGDLEFNRGWIAADVRWRGRPFRFVNTHLEALSNSTQVNQAQELIDWLEPGSRPTIVAGDMNVAAGSPVPATYTRFMTAGYDDAWAALHPLFSGATCCQQGDLRNETSELDRRIDLVLTREPMPVLRAVRVGHRQADRTAGGLWPSDHAGVVVDLRLP